MKSPLQRSLAADLPAEFELGPVDSRLQLFNATFDALTQAQTVDAVFELLWKGRRGWLSTVNVSTLTQMREQPWLQSYADRALMVVADGQPIVWCASLFGGKLPERIAGIDLLEALCARAETDGVGVYFLGGTSSVVHGAASEMRRRHPKLHIDSSDGYFAANSALSRIRQIRSSRAGLVFVGMGTPLQEKFIEEYFDQSGTGIAIGVGGSFDVIAGLRFRAPRWTARFGLEWLVRLVQEPRRLLWRYVRSNSVFCLLLVRTIASRLKPH